MTPKKLLPLATMEKLLKIGGAERVSDNAKTALQQYLEERAGIIAIQAVKLASHAGRKTIKVGDIRLAVKN